MPKSWRTYLTTLLGVLAVGTIIGWYYDHPDRGLLLAALAMLVWQVRRILGFEHALRTRNFDDFRIGEGIWQQMYSRFSYERRRARKFKRRYQRLVREFRKSTGALPDGGIILNDNFEIIRCNEQAQRLVGVHPKKDRGQRVDNILRDPRISQYLDSDARPETVEIESPVLDHTWLSCRLVPYGAEQHLLLVRDITETRKLIVMRRDFVANASHELRSPLTVISGYLDSLADDEALSRDWQKPIEQMQAQAARMNNIVKELLELSRLEASGPVRTDRAVDVCAILASSRKAYAGLDDTATVTVQCESSACLLGNEGEIESIVSNLLSNAIRHTRRDGAIALSWRLIDDGAKLTVSDTGEGISDDHIPRLTERFFRVDTGRSRQEGGIGLGLAIVKHALLRHDGQLDIDSALGKGSTFTCRFPSSRVAKGRVDQLAVGE